MCALGFQTECGLAPDLHWNVFTAKGLRSGTVSSNTYLLKAKQLARLTLLPDTVQLLTYCTNNSPVKMLQIFGTIAYIARAWNTGEQSAKTCHSPQYAVLHLAFVTPALG